MAQQPLAGREVPPGGTGRRVAVGTDGSPGSRLAVRWAAVLGGPGARLTVLRAWEPAPVVGEPLLTPTELDRGAERRTATAEVEDEVQELHRLLGPGEPEPTALVVGGRATSVLDDVSHQVDLVVVGTRGHGAVSGGLFGSVSRHVATHAACPVAVVPATAGVVPTAQGGEVVVAVDGSARDAGAARWAAQEARRLGARLTLVHAFSVLGVPSPTGAIRSAEQRRTDERAAEAVLLRAKQGLERELGRGTPVGTQSLEGPVAASLVERSAGALLLVLAAHESRVLHHRLGTVTSICIRHADCPVVIVPDGTGTEPVRAVLPRQPRAVPVATMVALP